MNIKIEESWKKVLKDEFEKDYFKKLSQFVKNKYLNSTVFPNPKNIFKAFEITPFDKVKVVIIGQDPYHNIGQANGLCFAVSGDQKLPPSLVNIFKEIETDLKIETIKNGDLSRWAKQGVFLLNSVLTVRSNSPGSHAGLGWETFTTAVIEKLSEQRENLVFILWGNYAKQKGQVIDRSKHLVLESSHPSPFSANSGFFGCKHFSKTNKYLKEKGLVGIDWQ
jgi:uracil-DNA glycosylase